MQCMGMASVSPEGALPSQLRCVLKVTRLGTSLTVYVNFPQLSRSLGHHSISDWLIHIVYGFFGTSIISFVPDFEL